ncbi:hypothetical protein OG21DRAFT_764426 [Imleria badia]|nr:hypothetical protein OG21DRAFT_764426 [Imleria badia]
MRHCLFMIQIVPVLWGGEQLCMIFIMFVLPQFSLNRCGSDQQYQRGSSARHMWHMSLDPRNLPLANTPPTEMICRRKSSYS